MGSEPDRACDHGRHEPHLAPGRRHHRVRHPRRRRQGEGAAGRGRGRHRLRRRRARLPHAGRTSSRRPPPPAPTRATTSTRPRRAARAPRGHRGQDRARLRLSWSSRGQVVVTNGGKHAVYNAFQTLLDPGDEVHRPRALLDHVPRGDRSSPTACPSGARHRSVPGSASRSSSSKRRARRAPRRCCSCRRATRPARSTRATEVEAIGRWAVEHGVWVLTDEIYEHLTYGGHEFSSMPVVVPELADTCVVLNGVAKTYAMTGWRVGWMIGPADVTAAAINLQSHQTSNVANVSPARRARRGERRPRRGGRDARRVRPPRPGHARVARRDPGRHLPRARGRVLLLPLVRGRARSRSWPVVRPPRRSSCAS